MTMPKKKTPAPLTFPVRSLDTWADAYQYILTACSEAGIELPLTAKQTPLLWKVRLKDLPVEQFDHLLHSLVDQVEMLRGITPRTARVSAHGLRPRDAHARS
jgi:hypothetical protein